MLNLNSIMVGTMQPKVMVKFYGKIFDRKPEMADEEWAGWLVGSSYFNVGRHSEMGGLAKDPGRVMFNLETEQVKEEYARMVKAGAKSVKGPYQMEGMWIATLSDPDGNYFQLMSPWKGEDKKATHYICTGGCKGMSDHPGVCNTEGCPLKGDELTPCDCTDGGHFGKWGTDL